MESSGRTFFRWHSQKKFFRGFQRKKVLPQFLCSLPHERSSSAGFHERRFFRSWHYNCGRSSSAQEGSSVESRGRTSSESVTGRSLFYRTKTLKGIFGILKICWVHQQFCWVPLANPQSLLNDWLLEFFLAIYYRLIHDMSLYFAQNLKQGIISRNCYSHPHFFRKM